MIARLASRLGAAALLSAGLMMPAVASAQSTPDFDAVAWQPLGCPSQDLIAESSPRAASFAGDQSSLPAFYAYDANHLYFRYRMDGDPTGPGGFAQYAWTALMQVPAGDPFQYQYQLSLNGKDDTVEIWQNTVATDIDFSPLFKDDSEVKQYSVAYKTSNLARAVPAGTSFNGAADWFVDFAFPVSALVSSGAISGAGDLAQSFFFPASATNPNNYNKSFLNCPFQPYTALTIQKTVSPTVAPGNTTTPVRYTIVVHNTLGPASGTVVEDVPLPGFLGDVAVQATSDDPDAAPAVVSMNPLLVKVPSLASGKQVTVELTANAFPTCTTADFVNTATTHATNALDQTASAPLDVQNTPGAGGVRRARQRLRRPGRRGERPV